MANTAKADLILVGTVHGDPRGYSRAWRALSHWRPQLVTVEISRFSWRYRRRQGRHWQRLFNQALGQLPFTAREHPAVQRVAAQIQWPFEYLVASHWGSSFGVPWVPVDISGPSRCHLPRYARELLTAANLGALAETSGPPLEDYVRMEFRRAHLRRRLPGFRLSLPQEAAARRREHFQAQRLRRLARSGRRLLHFGGWEHIVAWADGSGLANLLADLAPTVMLLDEADGLAEEKQPALAKK